MLRIPAGSFLMGAPETEADSSDNERPVHRVTLAEFLLAQTPVTQAQWRAVAEWQRPELDGAEEWPETLDPDPVGKLEDAERFRGDKRPVVNVSWRDAMAFCERLRLRTGKNYTLPSEAQWEYACRAGSRTPFNCGTSIRSDLVNHDARDGYISTEKGVYRRQTTDVASFSANAWGLHDMHGNMWEWCSDQWHSNYDNAPSEGSAWSDQDLSASDDVKSRLQRGGSWNSHPRYCRSAYRIHNPADSRNRYGGFRVCCLPQD
jgi:formylglycine-generating enzyme required for sulfatase activity